MLAIRTILAATDFSGCADAALDMALDIARRHGASVRLLHVREPSGAPNPSFAGGHPLTSTWELDLLQGTGSESVTLAWDRVPVLAEVESGLEATEAILSSVVRNDIDLLVMGTHGQHSVRRFLNDTPDAWSIGLTAREVLSETRCAVLAVGPRRNGRHSPPTEIVAGVDDSVQATAVMDQAAGLAASYGAPLYVVHVMKPGTGRAHRARVRRELIEQVRAVVGDSVLTDVQVPEGRPAESLIRFVRNRPGAALVVASHGHSSRGTVRIGSVADAVVRSSPCPVFTIKPFGKSLVVPTQTVRSRLVESVADRLDTDSGNPLA